MSEPENFLTRWSRRKQAAVEPDPPAVAAEAATDKPTAEDDQIKKPAPLRAQQTPVATEPEFDPASLPPLDSIGAQSDITAFLKPGVPGGLRLAALRRAWSADPAIRDFKGLAENDWDFTAPNSMMGFGEMDPGTDVQKMLADMFPEKPPAVEPTAEISGPQGQPAPPSHELRANPQRAALEADRKPAQESEQESEKDEPLRIASVENNEMVQREKNIAAQNGDPESDDAQIKRRRPQGGALPR